MIRTQPQCGPSAGLEPGEERVNSAVHALALLAALCGLPFLLASAQKLSAPSFAGAVVFAVTMVLLYLTSTVYHALPVGRAKYVLLKMDYGAIYFFIAGSYTPFALGALRGPWGWTLFGMVWTLAALGATLKALNRLNNPWLSNGLYLAMGWLVLIAAVPLVEHVPRVGVQLLVAGGLAYTVGIVFFVLDHRIRYFHAVWHACVATGTVCHFFAVMHYAS